MQGQAARAIASHGLNACSSRSHAVFTLWVETADAGTPRAACVARVHSSTAVRGMGEAACP